MYERAPTRAAMQKQDSLLQRKNAGSSDMVHARPTAAYRQETTTQLASGLNARVSSCSVAQPSRSAVTMTTSKNGLNQTQLENDTMPAQLAQSKSRKSAKKAQTQSGKVNKRSPKAASDTVKKHKASSEAKKYLTKAGNEQTNKEHQAKKDALTKIVENANAALGFVGFGIDKSFTPMNPAVFLSGLTRTEKAQLDKVHARLSAISYRLKEYVNSLQKTTVTPEVQVAVALGASGNLQIWISGNSSAANAKLQVNSLFGMGQYYVDHLRELNVRARRDALVKIGKSIKSKSATQALRNKGIGLSDEESSTPQKREAVARALHKLGKRTNERMRAKRARKFAKKHVGVDVKVAQNPRDMHAEAAILANIHAVSSKLQSVGGTKVACLACQAYFTHYNEQGLLGDHTGYAWLSRSSQAQLREIFNDINSMEDYLIRIYGLLTNRLQSLSFYTGQAGELRVADMPDESDADLTDSEDESAIAGLATGANDAGVIDRILTA